MILIPCPKCKAPIMLEIYESDQGKFKKKCGFCEKVFELERVKKYGGR
jgi:hypothetical protein